MKKIKLITPVIAASTLSAAIVPLAFTATSCSSKNAITAAEQKFLDDINTLCVSSGDLWTCQKAIKAVKAQGYDVVNYKLSNPNYHFAYDVAAMRFIIMCGDTFVGVPSAEIGYQPPTNTFNIFKFVDHYDKNSKYSQYLLTNIFYPEKLEVTTGVDTGDNTVIKDIVYTGNPKAQRTVYINTDCDILTINGANDTIYHYGSANDVYLSNTNSYHEYGKVAYLKVNNAKLNWGYRDLKDRCSISTVEVIDDSKTTLGTVDTGAICKFSIGRWINNLALADLVADQCYKEVTTMAELKDALTPEFMGFIRLKNDISFDSTTPSIEIDHDQAVALDLNGNSILDESGLAAGGHCITIKESAKPTSELGIASVLTIFDSKRSDNSKISLIDHPILVDGGKYNGSELAIVGANIEYVAKTTTSPAILVGDTHEANTPYWAYLYIYGGKITSIVDPAAPEGTHAAGVLVKHLGTHVQSVHGTIDCESTCISGHIAQSQADRADYTRVDITGGVYKTSDVGACIFQPQNGIVNINGGDFTGGLPIGMKDGTININGGVFTATAEYNATPSVYPQGIDIDGSVILFEASVDLSTPSLTVTNGILTSNNGNILSCSCADPDKYNGYFQANFYNGYYYYNKYPYDMSELFWTTISKYIVNQAGGTWTQLK